MTFVRSTNIKQNIINDINMTDKTNKNDDEIIENLSDNNDSRK